MSKLAFAFLASLLLSGCYESPSDLIGDHASYVQFFDSLIVNKNRAYTVTPQGNQSVLCELKERLDLKKPCTDGINMKLERTVHGNYIVQIREYKTANFKYALWLRSEPSIISATNVCVLWIGDGVVQSELSATGLKYENSKAFQALSKSLRNVATDPIINREQLLKIVNIYEQAIIDYSKQDWGCISDRTNIVGNLIAIDGDNRHIQPFELPKVIR